MQRSLYAPQTSKRLHDIMDESKNNRSLTTRNVRCHSRRDCRDLSQETTEKGVEVVERNYHPLVSVERKQRGVTCGTTFATFHHTHADWWWSRIDHVRRSNFLDGEQFEALMPREVTLYRVSTDRPTLPVCLCKNNGKSKGARAGAVCGARLRCKLPCRVSWRTAAQVRRANTILPVWCTAWCALVNLRMCETPSLLSLSLSLPLLLSLVCSRFSLYGPDYPRPIFFLSYIYIAG